MKNEKHAIPFDSKEMEEWLDTFFLDSFTNYLDETVFRIDLYESESAFIVEALLPNVSKDNIDLSINNNKLQIKVKECNMQPSSSSQIKTRSVNFPFQIEKMKIAASFQQDILEIIFYKEPIPS